MFRLTIQRLELHSVQQEANPAYSTDITAKVKICLSYQSGE
jgi:hypothetical protein